MATLVPAPKSEYRIDEPLYTFEFDPLDDESLTPYDIFVWLPNPRGQGWMGPPMAIWRFKSVPPHEPISILLNLAQLGPHSCELLVGGKPWKEVEPSVRSDYRIWPRQSVGLSLVGGQAEVLTIHRVDLVIAHPDLLAKHYSRKEHATSYNPEPDHFGEEFHQARLRQARRVISRIVDSRSRVLEAGSGYSLLRMAFEASGGFPGRLVACDWDREAMAQMSKMFPDIDWLVSDIEHLPFENESFDVLHVGEVIEHVIDPQSALSEWKRVIRPGGYLVVTTPNRKHRFARLTGTEVPENLEHLREYTVSELREELQRAGFTVTKVEGLYIALFAVKLPGQPWVDLLRSKQGFRAKRRLLRIAMEAGRLLPSHSYNICAVAKKEVSG